MNKCIHNYTETAVINEGSNRKYITTSQKADKIWIPACKEREELTALGITRGEDTKEELNFNAIIFSSYQFQQSHKKALDF